jgi:plastocyanin
LAFMSAIGYRLWLANATSANDTHPTTSTGLSEILNLTNAGIEGTTETETVVDYATTGGFQKAVATSQSYSIPMSMNLDTVDAGYAVLKQAALDAPTGQYVKWYRESPDPGASVTTVEKHAGIGIITDFSESIEAGGIATVSFTLQGYGAYTYTAAT